MIDRKTGELTIESIPLRLGPDFTRTELQSCLLANSSSVLIRNESFCSFSIGLYEITGLHFIISLWFYDEKLDCIDLVHSDKKFGSSWADWSESRELDRKHVHDEWLISLLGSPPYTYDWGTISSDFDKKSGGSSIVIRYSWQGKPFVEL